MGKSGGSTQTSNADNYYNQEANNSNQLLQQFNSMYLPMLQQLLPELQGTVNGQNTALTQAAQAPVNAQTSRSLNTIQGNLGGVTNPDALYSDIALGGSQNAGLAGDSMLNSALSALQNLSSMGYGSVNTAQNSLNNAAGGEANLGAYLNQQANAPWQQLLGAAGTAAGAYFGGPAGAAAGAQMFGGGGSGSDPAPGGAPNYNIGAGAGGNVGMPAPNFGAGGGMGPGYAGDSLGGYGSNTSAPISSTGYGGQNGWAGW